MRTGTVFLTGLAGLTLLGGASPGQALELDGDVRQGGLLIGKAAPGTHVYFGGREVRLGPGGRFVLGLGRKAPRQVPLAWREPDGGFQLRILEVKQRRYGVQRINGLPRNQVRPDESFLARLRRERSRIQEARAGFTPLAAFREGFRWPLRGPVTGVYGTRRVLNGQPSQPHFGIDIAASRGTPVRAPARGVVRLADEDLLFSGGTLIIDHGHGLTSSFLHLRRILVEKGARVRAGQPVAEVGSTGRSTGPHLDWRVNWFDKRLDPALLAGPMPERERDATGTGG